MALWFESALQALEAQLPAIVTSAEHAAQRYVKDGYSIRTAGDKAIWTEVIGRSGGIMEMNQPRPLPFTLNFLTSTKPEVPDTDESTTVNFAPQWLVDELVASGKEPPKPFIITHRGKLPNLYMSSDGNPHVAVDGVAAALAVWTWTAEFVSACTRLGKMPSMFQGYAVPGGQERARRLLKTNPKFHEEVPLPVPPGILAKAFLSAIRSDFTTVVNAEGENIKALAAQAISVLRAGKKLYLFPGTHIVMESHPVASEYFKRINEGWFKIKSEIQLTPGDLVFCVGFDDVFVGLHYEDLIEQLRSTGAVLAWSFTDYKSEAGHGAQAIGKQELFINQHWNFGDAVVAVPGYDIKILPTSGILAEAVLRMVEAEIVESSSNAPKSIIVSP